MSICDGLFEGCVLLGIEMVINMDEINNNLIKKEYLVPKLFKNNISNIIKIFKKNFD